MKKKRQVKEGSPFEEDNLLEMLKEEVRLNQLDKDQVKDIMNALVHFGLINQATQIHEYIARLMKAEHVCQRGLFSVEQQ